MNPDPPAPPEAVRDFEEFNDRAEPAGLADPFKLEVELKRLKSAMATAGLTAGKSLKGFNLVRLTLLPTGRLKISSSDLGMGAFIETVLAANFDPSQIPSFGIYFCLDAGALTKVAATFRGPEVTLYCDPKRARVLAASGATSVELPMIPNNEFISFHSKVQEQKHIRAIPVEALRQAIDFVRVFSREEPGGKSVSDLNVLEHGYFSHVSGKTHRMHLTIGGSMTTVSTYQCSAISGLDMQIRRDLAGVMSKALARLDPEDTHLFEAGKFYLLRDRDTFFGMEKGREKFPAKAIQRYISFEPDQIVSVSRKEILAALSRLSIATPDSSALLQMGIVKSDEGDGAAVILLKVQEAGGRTSEDRVEAHIDMQKGSSSYRSAAVLVPDLAKSLTHFNDPKVKLSVDASGVRVFDTGNGYTAMTILANASPAVSQTQRPTQAG